MKIYGNTLDILDIVVSGVYGMNNATIFGSNVGSLSLKGKMLICIDLDYKSILYFDFFV